MDFIFTFSLWEISLETSQSYASSSHTSLHSHICFSLKSVISNNNNYTEKRQGGMKFVAWMNSNDNPITHTGGFLKIIPLKQQFVPLPAACLLLCCDIVPREKATRTRKRRGIKRHNGGFLWSGRQGGGNWIWTCLRSLWSFTSQILSPIDSDSVCWNLGAFMVKSPPAASVKAPPGYTSLMGELFLCIKPSVHQQVEQQRDVIQWLTTSSYTPSIQK